MKKIAGLILILAATAIFLPSAAKAASGCCQVLDAPGPYPWHFETKTKEECAALNDPNLPNRGWVLSRDRHWSFGEGQTASSDQKSCIGVLITPTPIAETTKPVPPTLQVSVPGFTGFSEITCNKDSADCGIPWLAEYIQAIYNYGILIVGILSVIVMMIGGVMRITAGGNHEQINHANTYIKSSILGAIFAVCSYTILFLLNPNLVVLSPLKIGYIEKIDLSEVELIGHTPEFDAGNGKSISDTTFDTTFKKFAGCIGIDWRVLKGIAFKESHLNPSVVNKYGFTGLFQTKSIYCEESVRAIGYSPSFCNGGVKDPAVNTAVATGMMKVNLGTINSKCSSVSDQVKIFMIYYGHSNGGGALKKAINAHGCNVGNWPSEIFKGATKNYVTETVETVLAQGVTNLSNTSQNGTCR